MRHSKPPEKVPAFRPVMLDELRQIWTDYPTDDIRRLTLEIVRYRAVISEMDSMYRSIQEAWKHEVGGDLVGLYRMQQLLIIERGRC